MRHFLLFAASVSVLALSACSSMGEDTEKADTKPETEASQTVEPSGTEAAEMATAMGETVAETAFEPTDIPASPVMDLADDAAAAASTVTADTTVRNATPVAGAPTDCPEVQVLPDTKSITYFDGPDGKPTGNLVARAVLSDIRGGCDYSASSVSVDIDMIMQGKITDKGRYEGRRDIEAFMTFPYFVAIMAPDGQMIDKKIMATAMRFKPNVDDLDHAEKITQTIPLTDLALGPKYTITVGFQLNREQLEYNRGGRTPDAATPETPKETTSKKVETPKEEPKVEEKPKAEIPPPPAPAIAAPAPAPMKSSASKMKPVLDE